MGARISSDNEAKRQKTANIQLDDIPNEIVLKILSYVKLRTLLRCAQVCKRINVISSDETLYHDIDFSKSTTQPLHKVSARLIELVLAKGCKNLCVRNCKLMGTFKKKLPKVIRVLDVICCEARLEVFEE